MLKKEFSLANLCFIFISAQVKRKAEMVARKDLANRVKRYAMKGEGDRFIGTKKPKHLFSGKRGNGTHDRR